MKIKTTLALAALTLVATLPPLAADAARLTAEQVTELSDLVQKAECATLFERVDALRPAVPDDPDLLTLEGNCRLISGRQPNSVYLPERIERARIALGTSLSREDIRRLGYRLDPDYEGEALAAAEALFRRALDVAPEREDVVVGNVALLANTARIDSALALLGKHGSTFGSAARNDLGRLVHDLLRKGRVDDAEEFARGLDEAFPASSVGPSALALVAGARGRMLEALDALRRAHDREPEREAIVRELANTLLLARRWDEAVALLAPRVSTEPRYGFWFALAREGSAPGSAAKLWAPLVEEIAKNDLTDSPTGRVVAHFARAAKQTAPTTPEMHLTASRVFAKSKQIVPSLVEAEAAARGATRVEALVTMATHYRQNGLYDLALAALDDAVAATESVDAPSADLLAWGPGELQLARARTLFGLERDEEAARAYVVAATSGQAAPDELALATLYSGDRDGAVRMMQELATGGGQHAEWARTRLSQLGESVPASR